MKRTLLLLLVTVLMLGKSAVAQQVIEHKHKPYVDSLGMLYWNKHEPFYIRISTSASDAGMLLESKSHPNYVNPTYFDTEGPNFIRTRFAVDQKTKKAIKPEQEILWELQADGIAPVITHKFVGAPRYATKAKVFYGKGLSVELSAKDKLSGVENIYSSTNGQAYGIYSKSIPFQTEGAQTLRKYGVDNVGNAGEVETTEFVVDHTAPSTKHTVEGLAKDGVISKYTKIKLEHSDKLSGVAKTYYSIDGKKEVRYRGGVIPTAALPDGDHTITYYSIDHVDNKESVQTFKFYLDKISPIVDTRIVGDQHSQGAATYVSGRSKIELSATDNKSGVKSIKYSINGKPFEVYSSPVGVPQDVGLQTFRYTSEDEMTNKGSGSVNVKSLRVYVDLSPPKISHKFVGPQFHSRDTVFIRSNTDIKLYATDRESGVQRIGYKVDAGQENTYADKVNIMEEGMHEIEYTGYDNVNNAQTKKFNFIVDNNPPIIYEHFSITPLREETGVPIYSKHAIVFLAATDGITGNKTIHYKINGGPRRVYAGNISGFRPGQEYTISVEAVDQIGNKGLKEFKFKTDSN